MENHQHEWASCGGVWITPPVGEKFQQSEFFRCESCGEFKQEMTTRGT